MTQQTPGILKTSGIDSIIVNYKKEMFVNQRIVKYLVHLESVIKE